MQPVNGVLKRGSLPDSSPKGFFFKGKRERSVSLQSEEGQACLSSPPPLGLGGRRRAFGEGGGGKERETASTCLPAPQVKKRTTTKHDQTRGELKLPAAGLGIRLLAPPSLMDEEGPSSTAANIPREGGRAGERASGVCGGAVCLSSCT